MSIRKHLRRLAWLAKYSSLFADAARLPYGLGRVTQRERLKSKGLRLRLLYGL